MKQAICVIDYHDNNAPQQFSQALKKIGFAVIANYPISNALMERVYQEWYAFFMSSEKNNFPFDPKTHAGFIPTSLSETAKGYGKKDLKEFFHYYLHGCCPDACRTASTQLVKELIHLAGELLNWVDQCSPEVVRKNFSVPLSKMIEDSAHHLFRVIHYPPLTGDEPAGAVRAAAHEDINLLTLLPAATAEGLQVKDSDGNWIEVPINPGWIIVNSGDMLQECSNFYYPSTTHRVVNPTGARAKLSRMSMPLFFHPRADVKLSDRHTADSYRHERFAELGLL